MRMRFDIVGIARSRALARTLALALALAAFSCVPPGGTLFFGTVNLTLEVGNTFGSKLFSYDDLQISRVDVSFANASNPADTRSFPDYPFAIGASGLQVADFPGLTLMGGDWNAYLTGKNAAGEVVYFARYPFAVTIGTTRTLPSPIPSMFEGSGTVSFDISFPAEYVQNAAPVAILRGSGDITVPLSYAASTGRWGSGARSIQAGRYWLELRLDGSTSGMAAYSCDLAVFPAASGAATTGSIDLFLSGGNWESTGRVAARKDFTVALSVPGTINEDAAFSIGADPGYAGNFQYYWILDGVQLNVTDPTLPSITLGPWVKSGDHTLLVLALDTNNGHSGTGSAVFYVTAASGVPSQPAGSSGSIPALTSFTPTTISIMPDTMKGATIESDFMSDGTIKVAATGSGATGGFIAAWTRKSGYSWRIAVDSNEGGDFNAAASDTGIDPANGFALAGTPTQPLIFRATWQGLDVFRRGASNSSWGEVLYGGMKLSDYGILEVAAASASGVVHLAYTEEQGKARVVRYAKSTDGGATWSAPAALLARADIQRGLAIGCDASGTDVAIVVGVDDKASGEYRMILLAGDASNAVAERAFILVNDPWSRRSVAVVKATKRCFVASDQGGDQSKVYFFDNYSTIPAAGSYDVSTSRGATVAAIFNGGGYTPFLVAKNTSGQLAGYEYVSGFSVYSPFSPENGVRDGQVGMAVDGTGRAIVCYASWFFGVEGRQATNGSWGGTASLATPTWNAYGGDQSALMLSDARSANFPYALAARIGVPGAVALVPGVTYYTIFFQFDGTGPLGGWGSSEVLNGRSALILSGTVPYTSDIYSGALRFAQRDASFGGTYFSTKSLSFYPPVSLVLGAGGLLHSGFGMLTGTRYRPYIVSFDLATNQYRERFIDGASIGSPTVKLATSGSMLYALYKDDGSGRLKIAVSADSGLSFSRRATPIDARHEYDPGADMIVVGTTLHVAYGGALWTSADSGATWSTIRFTLWSDGVSLASRGAYVYAAYVENPSRIFRLAKIDIGTGTIVSDVTLGLYAKPQNPSVVINDFDGFLYFVYSMDTVDRMAFGYLKL